MKQRILLSGVMLTLAFTILGVRIFDALALAPQDDTAYSNVQVFTRALQLIRQDYVDDKKVSYRNLIYSALRGMLSSLDPHSQFMEPDDFKDMQDDTNSEFGGLGVIVSIKEGNIVIVHPMEGTPAAKAGLLPGDQILKINGASTDKMDLTDAIKQLRGDIGQKVTLSIFRAATREIRDFAVERAIVKVDSVKDAKLLDSTLTGGFKIGYVRITQFNKPTADELGAKLDDLEKNGMQALVLDLRYNPGGLLDSAVAVCGQFLAPHTAVVSTEGRASSQKRIYPTDDKAKNRKYPLAVLINGSSASGSEIVAGALKDLNRAILVGETSFGKGSVQSVVQLPDGSALRLTTAKYYTPSKQVINEHGVAPNIRATLTGEQERVLMLARRDEDSITDADKKEIAAFRDTQLERAADALKGAMIYGEKTSPKSAEKASAN